MSFTEKLYTMLYRVCMLLGKAAIWTVHLIASLGYLGILGCSYAARAVTEMIAQIIEKHKRKPDSEKSLSIGRSVIDFCGGIRNAVNNTAEEFGNGGFVRGIKAFGRNTLHCLYLLWKTLSPVLNYAAPVAALLFTFSMISSQSGYSFGLQLKFNGEEVGVIENKAVFRNAMCDVSAQVENATGSQYAFSIEPEYSLVLLKDPEYTETNTISEIIVENTPDLFRQSYGLFVDGGLVAANESEDVINSVLDGLTQKTRQEYPDSEVSFIQDVKVNEGLYPVTIIKNKSEIENTVDRLVAEEVNYTVVSGDSANKIASRFDIPLDELYQLNPWMEDSSLYPDDIVKLSASRSFLQVAVTAVETYEVSMEIPVEKIENDSMYKGATQVISDGKAGVNQITANVTYVDGVEVSRNVTAEKVISESVAKKIYVGTKPVPSTAPTGNWGRPIKIGYISSRYGWRTLLGRRNFHTGVDFAAPRGTPIYASDGGTIVFVGTNGNYGKLVMIDHGNGYVSYYGHCSAFADIKVGDKVYKGQLISYVGMTGFATGNHVHLEIRYKGETVNINSLFKS